MAQLVQKLVTQDSFDATNTLIPAGHVGAFDPARLSGNEAHLNDVGDFTPVAIQMSAIGPTGPNPTAPQQIPFDAVQGPGGNYLQPGKILVAERTLNADQRLAGLDDPNAENKVSEQLADLGLTDKGGNPLAASTISGSAAAAPVSADGTVADVTKDLGSKSDAELSSLRASEVDGKNRIGVLSAIDAETAARKA